MSDQLHQMLSRIKGKIERQIVADAASDLSKIARASCSDAASDQAADGRAWRRWIGSLQTLLRSVSIESLA